MAFRPAVGLLAAAAAAILLAPPCAQAAGDAARGQKLAYTCLGCHGIENYKNAYPNYNVPKVGGQSAAYLVAALNEYRSKARAHPTMQGHAGAMSDQDMQDIAAYFQGTDRAPAAAPVGTAPAAAATCVACHGPTGAGMTPDYPTIAGQHRDYLEQALNAYRTGKRKNVIMQPFAQQLSPEDIKALAAYFSAQKGVHTPRHP